MDQILEIMIHKKIHFFLPNVHENPETSEYSLSAFFTELQAPLDILPMDKAYQFLL